MDAINIYEIIGYAATIVTLISMAMSDVVKLRIVNCIGCLIFCVYGFFIDSYPIIVLNGIIFFINIYHIYKIKKNQK